MAAAGIWDRLPPDEFTKLQEYTKCKFEKSLACFFHFFINIDT